MCVKRHLANQIINEFLMIWPNLQQDLFNIIIRICQHKYALAADVTKMYCQIEVAEKDHKHQHILWR